MDENLYGSRDERGNWKPKEKPDIAPIWRTLNVKALTKWIIDYLWPWNLFHMVVTFFYIAYIIPEVSVMKTLSWDWALWILFANAAGIFILYGAIELFYYAKRVQGTRFKYNPKFPSDTPAKGFWFNSQNLDNFLRSFLSGIPIWTAIQVLVLWAYANTWGNWISWEEHKIYLIALVFLVPAIHEIHFFCIHRLIHTPWLYKHIHSVHHKSINPSPWSSLSMHPVEHILYFGEVVWHLIIPSHPVVAMFNLNMVAYGAINGHIGFEKLEMGEKANIDSHAYIHYLHHKYFQVNYGADWLIPLDKWFNTWHDGTKESEEKLKNRLREEAMKKRANA